MEDDNKESDNSYALANYFPQDLVYFYSFPAGENSHFYNRVPTFDEELVSGRPLICAGKGVKVITFDATSDEYVLNVLSQSVELIDKRNIIRLPQAINPKVTGNKRNRLITKMLKKMVKDHDLIMAQPLLDKPLQKKFKIDPQLSIFLNDKKNKSKYIPDKHLPVHYATFKNGFELFKYTQKISFPCVVKVTSSSSGDGVIICDNAKELKAAQKKFRYIRHDIVIEEFIVSTHNVVIHFGIPFGRSRKPEIIGFSEQMVSSQGDFFGGIINLNKKIPHLQKIRNVLVKEILPKVRDMGWYGIGGLDVLIRKDGNFFFIDPNFRVNASYVYVYLAKTGKVNIPLISFNGKVSCTKELFENQIMPFVQGKDGWLKIVSMTYHENTFRFNACIQFTSVKDLKKKAQQLDQLGVTSPVLVNILKPTFRYKL